MTSLPETTTGTAGSPAAPAPGAASAPGTPQGWARKPSTAPTGSIPAHEKMITDARERIDTIDDRIIGLIQERSAVSAVVQKARVEAGGRRVNLSREMEVLSHYRDALGKQGTALAMTLLELSRGRV
ncbi:chorismate mutase [Streptomyces sp. SPB074]|uniref:chorismate mutase n=1 Tax=Streptomyces sp. (strain SPB074) TaxID=465543 RepID=UPI00017F166C|nr:chorismate mutase [Streptomyces sp. SPB074]